MEIYNRFVKVQCVAVLLLIVSCSTTKNLLDHKPIYFNSANIHDTLNLKLSDVADVEFLVLKGLPFNDETYYSGNEFYIDSLNQYIYCRLNRPDFDFKLVQYDLNGNYIRHLSRMPGSYLDKTSVSRYYALPKKNRVGVSFSLEREIFFYDTTLNYIKKTKRLPFISDLAKLNERKILISTSREGWAYKNRKWQKKYPYFTISPNNGRRKRGFSIDYNYNNKKDNVNIDDFKHLQHGDGGVFLHYVKSDSIMWMNNKGRKFYPRLINVSEYSKPNIFVKISCETDKYVFLSQYMSDTSGKKGDNIKFYAYDKSEDKIYDLGFLYDCSIYNAVSRNYYIRDLLSDRCSFNYRDNSKNEGVLIELIPVSYFKDFNHKEGSRAAEVAKSLTGSESTVLAIVRFR